MRIGEDEQDVVVRNLSARGIGASATGQPPPTGASVAMLLPDGTVHPGTVRWVKGRSFGVELDEDLAVEEVTLPPAPAPAESQPGWKIKPLHKVQTPRIDPAKLRRI